MLDSALACQAWLSGDSFGVGDVPMGIYAHTYFSLVVDRPDLPNVRAWYDRLVERPA